MISVNAPKPFQKINDITHHNGQINLSRKINKIWCKTMYVFCWMKNFGN